MVWDVRTFVKPQTNYVANLQNILEGRKAGNRQILAMRNNRKRSRRSKRKAFKRTKKTKR